jgi:glucose-6-phosphate 1-dehydrogenase
MAAKIIPVPVFDCVVFGATGDLTLRKLLPALYYRSLDGQMPPDSRVIGAARSDLGGDEGFRKRAAKALHDHVAAADLKPEAVERFCACLHYVRIDAAKSDADWSALQHLLDPERVRVF